MCPVWATYYDYYIWNANPNEETAFIQDNWAELYNLFRIACYASPIDIIIPALVEIRDCNEFNFQKHPTDEHASMIKVEYQTLLFHPIMTGFWSFLIHLHPGDGSEAFANQYQPKQSNSQISCLFLGKYFVFLLHTMGFIIVPWIWIGMFGDCSRQIFEFLLHAPSWVKSSCRIWCWCPAKIYENNFIFVRRADIFDHLYKAC